MSSKIFRKASLEKLNSTENLFTAIIVTQPRGWLAILMICIIIALILVWSFVGSVYTRVGGQGILVRSGGMIQVVSMASGQIQEVVAEVGNFIKQGQVIARIHTPEQLNNIRNLKADIEDAIIAHKKLEFYHKKNLKLTNSNLEVKRSNQKQQLQTLENRKLFFNDRLAKEQIILKRGLITPNEIDNTNSQLNSIIDQINQINLSLSEMQSTVLNIESQAEREILNSNNNIDEFKRELRRQLSNLRLQSVVQSMSSGQVVEVLSKTGDIIQAGSSLLILENPNQKMEALLYVNSADGKKIKTGMEVDISPSTVRTEEYGSILGIVTYVSKYPASPEVMQQNIPNEALIQEMLSAGVPIEIHADLIPDHKTPSGYKWTSSTGPDVSIGVGTMAQCSIRVQDRRPITLVLPYLRKMLGVR